MDYTLIWIKRNERNFFSIRYNMMYVFFRVYEPEIGLVRESYFENPWCTAIERSTEEYNPFGGWYNIKVGDVKQSNVRYLTKLTKSSSLSQGRFHHNKT